MTVWRTHRKKQKVMEKNQKELMNKRKNETEIIKQRQKRNKEEHFTKNNMNETAI